MNILGFGHVANFNPTVHPRKRLFSDQTEGLGERISSSRRDDVATAVADGRIQNNAIKSIDDILKVREVPDIGTIAEKCERLSAQGAPHHHIQNAAIGVD